MIPDLLRGDLLKIEWVDIQEDGSGNPDEAYVARRTSYGLFWDRRDDGAVDCLVTTSTLDLDDHTQQGWCIYPIGCILRVTIVKAVRRKRAKKETPNAVPE